MKLKSLVRGGALKVKLKSVHRLVCGIGENSGKYAATDVDNKTVKEYRAWMNMLLRCTEKWWGKDKCYTGTTCSENFKSYSFFYRHVVCILC